MSICFVSDTIHSYFGSGIQSGTGGAERQQYLLATELQARGTDVSILTLDYKSQSTERIGDIGIWYGIPDVRGIFRSPYKTLTLLWYLRKIDADVYYVRGNDFLCMVTALYTELARCGFVYAVANDANVDPELLEERGLLRHPYVLAMRSADQVIAQTDHQRSLLRDDHGIDAVQIPNGYDVPPNSDLLSHSDREFVLWVGSMDPDQKKPRRYLDISRQFPDMDFVMIGPRDNDTPEHYDEIESEAKSVSNLEFVGFVDPDDIHDYYRRAIALVNTSDYEGFPNVFLEAWRYATPVVSLYHSLDGVLDEQPVGIHAGSMDALVDAVDRIVSDVSFRKKMGEGGRELMIENYSFHQLIDRYKRVFEDVFRNVRR